MHILTRFLFKQILTNIFPTGSYDKICPAVAAILDFLIHINNTNFAKNNPMILQRQFWLNQVCS